MDYKCVIHKDFTTGLWCASKHYSDNTIGENYAFAVSPKAVEYKLEDDGEELEDIVVDDQDINMETEYVDDETGVVAVRKNGDCFSVHLGNNDFELEMSKKEFGALLRVMFEALINE